MVFHVPEPAGPPELPPELAALVEESAKNFETHLRQELGIFGSAMNLGKWIQNYRLEVTRVVLMVRSMDV